MPLESCLASIWGKSCQTIAARSEKIRNQHFRRLFYEEVFFEKNLLTMKSDSVLFLAQRVGLFSREEKNEQLKPK